MLKYKLKKAISEKLRIGDKFTVQDAPKDSDFEFSSNLLFVLAKAYGKQPEEIFKEVAKEISEIDAVEKVNFSPPVFLNFSVSKKTVHQELIEIIRNGDNYPEMQFGGGEKVLFEYVSANPTGPLHVGHARSAFLGDSLSKIYKKLGYMVHRQFYVNDIGYQMYLLGMTVKLKFEEMLGKKLNVDEKNLLLTKGYKGSYIDEIVKEVYNKYSCGDIKESEVKNISFFIKYAVDKIMNGIKSDLDNVGIEFDEWVKESAFYKPINLVEKKLNELKEYTYEKEGAIFFKTKDFGDEKDRVVLRSKRQLEDESFKGYTYFASDVYYHWLKFNLGYNKLINIWGADHHGYVPRVKAAIQAMGYNPDLLKTVICQFVSLKKGDEVISMSTREGKYVSMAELINEVGIDASKFFLLAYSPNTHVEFDIELAKKKSMENPVYYIQYAHTRCCGIFRKFGSNVLDFPLCDVNLNLLNEKAEKEIIFELLKYGDVLISCAEGLSLHFLTSYLFKLSTLFHNYYEFYRVISENKDLMQARLTLVKAVQTILRNGLNMLGISAPERM